MTEQFYLTKSIDPTKIEKASDDDTQFLGYATIDVATTHKDRVNDTLTKGFITDSVKQLMENNSVFLNHKTMDDPVAKVVSGSVIPLQDGEYSARIKVGFSKTAVKQWTLVQEGILNKASIGFYLADDGYDYDEETDTLVIDKGYVVEFSFVGVPANGKASLIDVSKKLKALFIEKKEKQNKNIGENDMDDEKIKALLDGALAKAMESFDEKLKAQTDEHTEALDTQASDFEKALEAEKEKTAKLAEEAKLFEAELEKANASGRKTGKDLDNENKDPYFLLDEDMALKKGFFDFGEIIKSGDDFVITLLPSNDYDVFRS